MRYKGLIKELGKFYHYDPATGWFSVSLRWMTFMYSFTFLSSIFVMLYVTCLTQEGHEEYDCY